VSKYTTFLNEVINNIKNYDLYFAVILLAKYAVDENLQKVRFKSDIKVIKHLVEFELNNSNSIELDILDATEAFSNTNMLGYPEDYLLSHLRIDL
jgi:hypothetical protein